MAAKDVIAQVVGGEKKVVEGVENVAQVREKMGLSSDYTATVNTDPVDDNFTLRANDYVAFTRKVKGGQ